MIEYLACPVHFALRYVAVSDGALEAKDLEEMNPKFRTVRTVFLKSSSTGILGVLVKHAVS